MSGSDFRGWEDKIHKALAHPTRRRLIEILLKEQKLSFNELLKRTSISNHGKFGFHLRQLKGLVEYDSSTSKYRLTEIGKIAGMALWETRFAISGGRERVFNPTEYVRHLGLGEHAVLFYETEDMNWQISFSFMEAGLLNGEAVVYLVSDHKLDLAARESRLHGIGYKYFDKKAFTIMSADEWYLIKGKAHAETIIANWQRLINDKLEAGFRGLRAAAEMETFFDNAKTQELLKYESAIGRKIPLNICALCIYDAHRFLKEKEQFVELNKSHGHSIFKGIALETLVEY